MPLKGQKKWYDGQANLTDHIMHRTPADDYGPPSPVRDTIDPMINYADPMTAPYADTPNPSVPNLPQWNVADATGLSRVSADEAVDLKSKSTHGDESSKGANTYGRLSPDGHS